MNISPIDRTPPRSSFRRTTRVSELPLSPAQPATLPYEVDVRRGGKKVHSSTVYRWATQGARGRMLESVMVGGIRYTTIEAVRRFLTANSQVVHMAKSSSQNELDQAIEEELRQAGV